MFGMQIIITTYFEKMFKWYSWNESKMIIKKLQESDNETMRVYIVTYVTWRFKVMYNLNKNNWYVME